MQYKVRVPVCGAIILNKACDKALLVRGYKSSASWSFPRYLPSVCSPRTLFATTYYRGKINKDEALSDCAVRECLEEIGFDISPYLSMLIVFNLLFLLAFYRRARSNPAHNQRTADFSVYCKGCPRRHRLSNTDSQRDWGIIHLSHLIS